MELTQHLYLKIGSNVRGPVSANVLHRMFKDKEIDSSAMFSFDGNKWASITKLFSSKAAKKAHESSNDTGEQGDDPLKVNTSSNVGTCIPELLKRVNRASVILNKSFSFMTYLVFAACSIVFSMGICLALRFMLPAFSPLLHIAIGVVPAILMAGVAAHFFGNFYIKTLTKLSLNEKYSLAIHVPWENAPEEWGQPLAKWLYLNDWLIDSNTGDMLPYVRAFVTGVTPNTVDDEVDLWKNILQGSKKSFDPSVGRSVRELACLQRLPAWTAEITPGMNLHELEKSLGSAGRKWALSLLKRAAARRKDLQEAAQSGDLDQVIFEFFCSKLADGRECLLVIISNHGGSDRKERKLAAANKERAA